MQDVENSLVTLSEKITMCNEVLNDLKHLNDVLVVSLFSLPGFWDLWTFWKLNLGCFTEEVSAGCSLTTTELTTCGETDSLFKCCANKYLFELQGSIYELS